LRRGGQSNLVLLSPAGLSRAYASSLSRYSGGSPRSLRPRPFQLEFFHPDHHITDGFNSILDPIDLPMNRLDNTFDFLSDISDINDVAADTSNLETHEIDQFLCSFSFRVSFPL
jgi:hypothetical protein